MTTPEGAIKKKIREVLEALKPDVYYYMSVPHGYGRSTVDYLGCVGGQFFAIEAKAPKKKPTELQEEILKEIREAGGAIFVINDDQGVYELMGWLTATIAITKV